jgi:hypothetical protein
VRRGLGTLAAGLVLAGALAGCVDPRSAARGSCQDQDVGELRCRAIVSDAGSRLPGGRAPITGVEVHIARMPDRTTLRDQTLVATVTFSYLDGSTDEIPVFCGPVLARTPVCVETTP